MRKDRDGDSDIRPLCLLKVSFGNVVENRLLYKYNLIFFRCPRKNMLGPLVNKIPAKVRKTH
jgi:hypothetical protein